MGYFSELDIELQELEQEVAFDWQEEQRMDELENCGIDPDFNAALGIEELKHIEEQADTQELIHNGYWE